MVTSSREIPFSAASLNASRTRPSRSTPSATYTPFTGTPARSASTTALRPAIHSSPSPLRRFGLRAASRWARADAIRDRIAGAGIAVEDTPDGPQWTLAEGHD